MNQATSRAEKLVTNVLVRNQERDNLINLPTLQSLFLAKEAYINDYDELNYTEIISEINSESFPKVLPTAYLSSTWKGTKGLYSLKIMLADVKSNVIIFERQEQLEITKPEEISASVIELENLTFKNPGNYQLKVLINNQPIFELPLKIKQKLAEDVKPTIKSNKPIQSKETLELISSQTKASKQDVVQVELKSFIILLINLSLLAAIYLKILPRSPFMTPVAIPLLIAIFWTMAAGWPSFVKTHPRLTAKNSGKEELNQLRESELKYQEQIFEATQSSLPFKKTALNWAYLFTMTNFIFVLICLIFKRFTTVANIIYQFPSFNLAIAVSVLLLALSILVPLALKRRFYS